MKLDQVELQKEVKIEKVNGEGMLRVRLLEMGLTPRTIIKINKIAPLGDPIEILVRGYSLTLRKEDCQNIEVSEVK